MLDDEAIFPGATEDSFMERLFTQHGDHPVRRKYTHHTLTHTKSPSWLVLKNTPTTYLQMCLWPLSTHQFLISLLYWSQISFPGAFFWGLQTAQSRFGELSPAAVHSADCRFDSGVKWWIMNVSSIVTYLCKKLFLLLETVANNTLNHQHVFVFFRKVEHSMVCERRTETGTD